MNFILRPVPNFIVTLDQNVIWVGLLNVISVVLVKLIVSPEVNVIALDPGGSCADIIGR
jgi:hypothetical protein